MSMDDAMRQGFAGETKFLLSSYGAASPGGEKIKGDVQPEQLRYHWMVKGPEAHAAWFRERCKKMLGERKAVMEQMQKSDAPDVSDAALLREDPVPAAAGSDDREAREAKDAEQFRKDKFD
eukprot:CAMPEP_0167800082 /NCGR_PEP_ID=MMETSP0111_2-20121227/17504_1 /TAXON_ID=91324 /ORGANISM="Lotharella globosa, Strain CCCM811" /LENGTH=120 /DNA_ID=CAMNT_0007695243 /DNA_START=37 /DNA_END=396 /DNA_ORIENTATION=-